MTSLEALKWALVLAGLCCVPLFAWLLGQRPQLVRWTVFALGFLPFAGLRFISLNLLSRETYRGDSRGLEVTLIDLAVCALFLGLPKSTVPAPYRRTRAFYLFAVLLSVAFAAVPLYSAFSVWKLLRMYLLLVVVARACLDAAVPPFLLRGMGLGIIYEALLAGWQHYLGHQYQAAGNLNHPNSLTMACNLIAPIALALLLARRRSGFAATTLLAASVCVVFALSRGSLVMFALSMILTFGISAARKLTGRKLKLAGFALLALLVVCAKALPTIVARFEKAPAASLDARIKFEHAAWLMLQDHPMGIGINQFSYVLEHGGYGARAGITADSPDTNGIVHNIYRLTAAELGLLGLVAYLLLMAAPLLLAVKGAAKSPHSNEGQVLMACAVALVCSYLQGTLEWLSRQTSYSYLFFMMAGLVAALDRHVSAQVIAARSRFLERRPPTRPALEPAAAGAL